LPFLVALAVSLVVAGSGLLAASARADGDPASDVLATQALYLPQDAGLPPDEQAQIAALVHAAGGAGYPLRVALISSPADLGSVTELWRQPENYARFLGAELSLIYRGTLLVIMPNGYGVARVAGSVAGAPSSLAGLRAPGPDLATATVTAVRRLAAASGHDLPVVRATAPPRPATSNLVSWIVFALGAGIILIAWTASLRARPLRDGGTRMPG
jgi:hypothetical protein